MKSPLIPPKNNTHRVNSVDILLAIIKNWIRNGMRNCKKLF